PPGSNACRGLRAPAPAACARSSPAPWSGRRRRGAFSFLMIWPLQLNTTKLVRRKGGADSYLSPLCAGRGRRRREATTPGEGQGTELKATPVSQARKAPHPNPLPAKSGEREKI